MSIALVLVAALTGADAPAPATLHLASPGLTAVNMKADLSGFFSEHLAQQLKLAGAEVVTPKEISALLGMERQASLLGCTQEATSCVAELASALGVDGVVMGDVARVGDKHLVNVKIIASSSGKTVAAVSESGLTEEQVPDALTRAARAMAVQAADALHRRLDRVLAVAGPRHHKGWALVPLGAGLLVGGIGLGSWLDSEAKYQALVTSQVRTAAEGQRAAASGAGEHAVGVVCMAAGGALLVTSLVVFLTGEWPAPQGPAVSLAPLPSGGAVLSLSGSLP